jgi:hypothetical protein
MTGSVASVKGFPGFGVYSASKAAILFNHAFRYPMRFVRQGAKRRRAPDVLTAAEIKELVDHLPLRERTLVLLAVSTGLRQSECSESSGETSISNAENLAWSVRSFSVLSAAVRPNLHRSRFLCIPCLERLCWPGERPAGSRATMIGYLPVDCTKADDPIWGAAILRKYIRPVAASLNIPKRIGWHTFRHLLHPAQKRRSRVQGDAGIDEAFQLCEPLWMSIPRLLRLLSKLRRLRYWHCSFR